MTLYSTRNCLNYVALHNAEPVAIRVSAGEDRGLWSDASSPKPGGPLRDDRTQEGPICVVRELKLVSFTLPYCSYL